MNDKWTKLLATGFNSGLSPIAPGTVGTIAGAVLLALVIKIGLVPEVGFPLVFILLLPGIYIADQAEDIYGEKDAPQIVIDEIVGFVIAMYGLQISMLIPAFILFRIFDILKPVPLNKLQEFKGGLGIMLDDIAAGIVANLLLRIIIYFV
ncbi:phosphatidylglycerophosphatase A-like protein [Halobacteroides halobius DSM 5150]|uniref:Phosphatidylglycerophosphatase A-like protein n=1 Tax=Halobacteroides halobius (strain ATCC 35273 / DSM 5150 / MD-1) TaxID=748449 RepID=L0KB05_HALHC|nr:phosphatidylglycerophosphatase A [Halobacteroides halobius]AGB41554.1 phosphatidylglycerophosphatase A-like protein [Halobacteroides halobius DSM 5150]